MKCFEHPDTDAVGMCKHCGKGICKICAKETEYGISCEGECTIQLFQEGERIELNKQMATNIANKSNDDKYQYTIYALMCAVVGVLIMGFGVRDDFKVGISLGVVMLVVGIASLIRIRRTPVIYDSKD